MTRVLCIEDDPSVAQVIQSRLQAAGFEVQWIADGAEGLAMALAEPFDMITLDRCLPGMDGLNVLHKLRAAGISVPVMMISGLDTVDERIEGLRAGGDEYLVKPFHPEEMVARLQVVLRQRKGSQALVTELCYGDLCLDLLLRCARCGTREQLLKPTQFRLLEFFLRNAGEVVNRALIFESVWGYRFDPGTKLIDVQLTHLRKALEELGSKVTIETLRGAGFCLQG